MTPITRHSSHNAHHTSHDTHHTTLGHHTTLSPVYIYMSMPKWVSSGSLIGCPLEPTWLVWVQCYFMTIGIETVQTIKDGGSPGRPPRPSHISWALSIANCPAVPHKALAHASQYPSGFHTSIWSNGVGHVGLPMWPTQTHVGPEWVDQVVPRWACSWYLSRPPGLSHSSWAMRY